MSHVRLTCRYCQIDYPIAETSPGCLACDAPLDMSYSGPGLTGEVLPGIWKSLKRSPIHRSEAVVSLGEGATPILRLEKAGKALGLESLTAKLEFVSPTGSFKDRGSTVLVSLMRELGHTAAANDSSGNAGASLAAYCARAGIRLTVFVPAYASEAKVHQIRMYGAEIRVVQGSREDAEREAQSFSDRNDIYYASHNWSPAFVEGMGSFAYELADQLEGQLPDHVVFPVGNGSLLMGSWLAFKEMAAGSVPLLHAVQARAVMPMVAALRETSWEPAAGAKTVADGVAVSRPPRRNWVVEAVRGSRGTGVAVDEQAILQWQGRLAREEGVFCEPTSAVAFAGLEALVREGVIRPGERVVVPVTGSGLKEPPKG